MTASATRSPPSTQTATPTPAAADPGPPATAAADGELVLQRALPVPQPVRPGLLRLRVLSDGAYDGLELRLYSVARVEVLALESAVPARPGWSEARFGLPPLPQGLYHFRLRARRGPARSRPLAGSLFLLGPP